MRPGGPCSAAAAHFLSSHCPSRAGCLLLLLLLALAHPQLAIPSNGSEPVRSLNSSATHKLNEVQKLYGIRTEVEDINCPAKGPCYNASIVEPFNHFGIHELYSRLQKEHGLRKLLSIFEALMFPDGPPTNCSSFNASLRGARNTTASAALCLQPHHLQVPHHWVPFQDFLKGNPAKKFPCSSRPFYPACPYLDGLGFRNLADHIWETVSYIFGNNRRQTFNVKNMVNRSLVYWNIGVYGPDMSNLRRLLPEINAHFFLVQHNTDNPRFPDWLLDSPKVLKIFASYVPEMIWHPKVIALPLGLMPFGKKIATKLENATRAARRTSSRAAEPMLPTRPLMMAGFTLGKKHLGRALFRRYNRRFWLQHITPRFGTTLKEATTTNYTNDAYYRVMREHRFVLSLPGTGVDGFRTWESLYLGRPPVISSWMSPWSTHELPVYRAVLHLLKPADLEREWSRLSAPGQRFNVGRLWMQWWVTRIVVECLMIP